MGKITLNPAPIFTLPVDIPVAGQGQATITLTFKHRSKSALDAMFDANRAAGEAGTLDQTAATLDLLAGWDLDDAFTPENVALFLDNYPGAAVAIMAAYATESYRVRLGN